MDPTSTRLYTARLGRENEADVLVVLQNLAESERAEFETAVPDIATILKLVEAEKIARENRLEAAKNKRLVGFQCPECRTTCTGFYAPSEDVSNKRCRGNVKEAKYDRGNPDGRPICGARLIIVFDADIESANDQQPWEQPEWMTR